MVTKDVKRGLRILSRQLPPGLVIWDGLEGERPIERRGEPRDLVRRSERFGATEPIGVSGVSWLSECSGGDFGDVGRIDHGRRGVAERRAYDVPSMELVAPTQHVGLEGAGAKNGPGESRRLHRLFRFEVVGRYGVTTFAERRGT